MTPQLQKMHVPIFFVLSKCYYQKATCHAISSLPISLFLNFCVIPYFFCISSSVILPFVSYLIFLRSALGSLFFFLYPSFCIFLNLSEPVLIVGLSFCELALPFLLFHCFFSCIFTLFSVSLFFFISF